MKLGLSALLVFAIGCPQAAVVVDDTGKCVAEKALQQESIPQIAVECGIEAAAVEASLLEQGGDGGGITVTPAFGEAKMRRAARAARGDGGQ